MPLHQRKAGLYILALCAGCRPPTHYEVQLEEPMPADAWAVVLTSVNDWQVNLPELKVDVIAPAPGCRLSQKPCISIEALDDALIDTTESRRYIAYPFRLSDADAGHVLRHRLGHLFGLVHGGAGTVMDPNPETWAFIVTPADVEAFRAARR